MPYTDVSMIGDKIVRYCLSSKCSRPLIVFGVNPSTADNTKSDHTISRVIGFAKRLGFDGFIMLNIYPVRATNFYNLPKTVDESLHAENLRVIRDTISQYDRPTILMAYGDHIAERPYLRECFRDILSVLETFNLDYIQFGDLTNNGYPRHPGRISYNIEIKPFDKSKYLK
jgi:serine/threonine protein phosphatase 1